MRAPQHRASLRAALILPMVIAAPLACTKNNPNTNVKIANGEGDDGVGGGARVDRDGSGTPARPANIEKIQISGSIVGVGDMLDAGSTLLNMWSPPEPGLPAVNIRTFLDVGLVQEGFGPGFLASIDLDGIHAVEFAFPHDGQPGTTDADIDLSMVLSAISPARAIESLPADLQPQPMGQDMWHLIDGDVELLFRAHGDALEMATKMASLDVAAGLRDKVAVGPNEPRIHLSASNLPPGEIDVTDIIPLPGPLAGPLSAIMNETTAVDFAADFGSDRDLFGRVGAVAPFSRLGLDPIGPATQAPSALAKALPDDAMFVWLMPWGDPAMLDRMLDKQIPVDQIPAPFDGYIDDVVKGLHGVLGQIRTEVLVAVYLDSKGQMTIALAAEVGDEKLAQKAIRGVWEAAEKAFKDHIALTKGSADHAYTVSFKEGTVKAGKAKGDLFTLTVPKDKQADLAGMSWLVGSSKPKLEISTVTIDGKLIVAIGAGQKAFMSDLGKSLGKGEGLETGGGLALARKVTNGCQYCMAMNPVEFGEMLLTVYAADPKEPDQVHKAAKDGLAKLGKLGLDGEVALALRLDADRGEFGFGVPKALLFAEPAKIKTLVELMGAIDKARDEAYSSGWTPGEATAKSDGAGGR